VSEHVAPRPRPLEVALLASVFVVAACGLVYELAAGALASYVLGDSVLQFSTIIGTYLFAMGVGSWLSRYFERQLPAHFLRIELLVALVGGFLPALLFLVHAWQPGAFRVLLYGLVLLVGLLVGLEIPLVMRILKRDVGLRELVSQVLTFDYLGALAVSVAFPLLLVPQLGLIRTGLLFGLMNALVALWALWLFRHELRRFVAHAVACVLTVGVLTGAFAGSRHITSLAEDRFYQDKIVLAESSPWQRIVLTQGRSGLRLYLNGNLQFAQADEYRYHEALVHPALAAHGAPRKVAVLGGGDGLAVREVLRHPQVESVTLVELDPNMTRLFASDPRLVALNGGALQSPKVKIVNADAFQWLQQTGEMFDVIVVDFPDPTNFSHQLLHRQALHQCVLFAAGPAPRSQRLRGGADHLAPGCAPELLDRGDHDGIRGPAHRALSRQRAELRRVGLHHREPPALARAGVLARGAALSHAGGRAAPVRLSARHGPRTGGGAQAGQPGAGDHLRA